MPKDNKTETAERLTKALVLDTAKCLVDGDRARSYGDVNENFDDIARLWNAWITARYKPLEAEDGSLIVPPRLDAIDVALMMAGVKQARLAKHPQHADSWIDLAGYAACGGEVSKAVNKNSG